MLVVTRLADLVLRVIIVLLMGRIAGRLDRRMAGLLSGGLGILALWQFGAGLFAGRIALE